MSNLLARRGPGRKFDLGPTVEWLVPRNHDLPVKPNLALGFSDPKRLAPVCNSLGQNRILKRK